MSKLSMSETKEIRLQIQTCLFVKKRKQNGCNYKKLWIKIAEKEMSNPLAPTVYRKIGGIPETMGQNNTNSRLPSENLIHR